MNVKKLGQQSFTKELLPKGVLFNSLHLAFLLPHLTSRKSLISLFSV